MPWTGQQFKTKHNLGLTKPQAAKGARVATAMVKAGVPEGEAIATGNARAENKPMSRPGTLFGVKKTRRWTGA